MRVAIPVWKGRISPVLNVARSFRIFDILDGTVVRASRHRLEGTSKTLALRELGVDVVICAAISSSLEATLWISGIEVISDFCGTADEIIDAFVSGDTEMGRFRSPGCGRSGRNTKRNLSRHLESARVLW
jgi:predicted Fe-Mo cluster-binding NifX family protein